MVRRYSVLFFILLALWQSVTAVGLGVLFEREHQLPHIALHWESTGHHHSDDGAYQVDDSQDSVQHVLGDSCHACAALLVAAPAPALAQASQSIVPVATGIAPSPDPEGLRRPPRLTA